MKNEQKTKIKYSLGSEADQLEFNLAFGFLISSIILLIWWHNFVSLIITAAAIAVFYYYYNHTHDGILEFSKNEGEIYFSDINNSSRVSLKVEEYFFFWHYAEPSGVSGSSDDLGTSNGMSANLEVEINLKLKLENQETYLLKRVLTPWQDTPHWTYNPAPQMVTSTYEVADLKAAKKLFSQK